MIWSDWIQAEWSRFSKAYMSNFSSHQVVIYHFNYTFWEHKSRFFSFIYIATDVTFIFLIIKVVSDILTDSDVCLDCHLTVLTLFIFRVISIPFIIIVTVIFIFLLYVYFYHHYLHCHFSKHSSWWRLVKTSWKTKNCYRQNSTLWQNLTTVCELIRFYFIMFCITVTPNATLIFAWRYWILAPKRR